MQYIDLIYYNRVTIHLRDYGYICFLSSQFSNVSIYRLTFLTFSTRISYIPKCGESEKNYTPHSLYVITTYDKYSGRTLLGTLTRACW
jgi:hypothetical protein